ncbi:MAG: hypothetical protein AABX59_00550 [Nanoarchaeota archaeon]
MPDELFQAAVDRQEIVKNALEEGRVEPVWKCPKCGSPFFAAVNIENRDGSYFIRYCGNCMKPVTAHGSHNQPELSY